MKILKIWLLVALLSACASADKSYTLEAEIIPQSSAWLVKGRSNLPEMAQLLVALLDPKEAGNYSRHVVVQEFTLIKNQRFEVRLKPLRSLAPGSYQVRVSFNPQGYDWSGGKVIAEVGARGEHLRGPHVLEEEGVKKLVRDFNVEYKGKSNGND